jgi:hypothetical protein
MTGFVIRSLWEVPITIAIGIFLFVLVAGTFIRLWIGVAAIIVAIVRAVIGAYRDRRDARPIIVTYDRTRRPVVMGELPPAGGTNQPAEDSAGQPTQPRRDQP